MRKSLFLAAATLFVVSASPTKAACPAPGMLALGTSNVGWTPVGIRYWASDKVAIDGEIGFWSIDGGNTTFKGQLGIPINLICCSDVWLHFRPFVLFENISPDVGDSITNLYFGGALEAEAWLTECLSFSVWHGLVIESLDGGSGGSSSTNIHLEGSSLGNAGFHFYFP